MYVIACMYGHRTVLRAFTLFGGPPLRRYVVKGRRVARSHLIEIVPLTLWCHINGDTRDALPPLIKKGASPDGNHH